MKTLYISSKPCYPQIDGGCVASANFLNILLDAEVDIEYLTISTPKHPFKPGAFPPILKEKINPTSIQINTSVNPFSAFKYLFNNKSYNIERFYSKEFENEILNKLQINTFDNVILDGLYATPYIEQIRNNFEGKVIVRTHNVEFKIWEDLSKNERNAFKARYLKKLAKDLKRYECSVLKKADGVMTISTDDLNQFKCMDIENMISIPLAIKPVTTAHNYANNSLFHVGSMNWIPNFEAVQYIANLMPRLRVFEPQLQFFIAGLNAKDKFQSKAEHGIVVEGYVEDLKGFIDRMGILVTPIQSGSGVRVKILEMMAYGIPIITTSAGAEGLLDKSALRIANTQTEIVEAIYELRNSEKFRKELGIAAQRYIKLHHDPKAIREQLIAFIQST